MPRYRFALLLLTGLLPAQALAQSSANLTVYYDDESIDNQSNVLYINAQQCNDNIEVGFEVSLRNTAVDPSQLQDSELQLWESATGTDCRAAEGRQDGTGGSDCAQADCRLAANQNIQSPSDDLRIDVPVRDLFGDGDGGCDSGTRKITLVVVSSASCGNAEMDQLPSAYTATFTIRTTVPAKPTNVNVADGDSTLRASWSAESGRTTDEYTVYVDTDPGNECGNSMFMEDMTPGVANDLVDMVDELRSYTTESRSYNLNTETLGLEVGDYAAVFVSTRDTQAGNRGPLSALACGRRIPTTGVIDAVEDATGDKVQTCNGSGANQAAGGSAAVLLGLLGLWLVRRRESRA